MSRAKGEYKVVLLGEGRVGKTSMISRFVNDTFNENESSTTQATMYSVKAVPIAGGCSEGGLSTSYPASGSSSGQRMVKLAVWDTAGQERFHALAPIYYRNAAGAMLVYDVCDADSLKKVQTWVKELRTVAGDRIRLVVCGNKCDRPVNEQEVSPAEALAVASDIGAQHFFTSAKTGINVADAFSAMAAAVFEDTTSSRGNHATKGGGGGEGNQDDGANLYDTVGRRRRRRGIAADDDAASDLFLDYGSESGLGGGMRTSADYGAGGGLRPPRAARPLTLEEMKHPGESAAGDSGSGRNSSGGGSCC